MSGLTDDSEQYVLRPPRLKGNVVDGPLLVAVGAAFGTSKAGIGIAGLGGFRPELIMKVSNVAH